MKKPKRSTSIAIGAAIAAFIIYFIVVGILGLPFYVVPIIYVVAILLATFIFRYVLMAIYGNFCYMSGNQEKARKYLLKALEHNVKSPAANTNYGIMLMREGKVDEAFRYLERALALNTTVLNEKNIITSLGTCYWMAGDTDKAIETLEGMREKYEYVNGRVLTTLGYLYYLKGDYDTAEDISKKAIADMPEHAGAWDNLGQIYYKQGNIEKAKEHFEKAIGFKSDLPDSLYALGLIYKDEGDSDKARELLDKALTCEITSLNTVSRAEIEAQLSEL